MDKFAIISDIHGNIPALEAVYSDIKGRGLKRIICLGDLAGKGPGSPEAVDMIRDACETVIKGNWDLMLYEMEHEMASWYQKQLGRERLDYLNSLPLYLEFYMSGRLVRLFHASPFDLFYRTYVTTEKEKRLRLFEPTPTLNKYSDVVGYGDIHGAHIDNFDGKTIFNPGSVGNPLDITLASYAVLEGEYGSEKPSPFSISIIRVPYDIDKAVSLAQASDMPAYDKEAYIKELRTAVYRNLGMKHN